ncbi:MAG TPA: hypothetical protein VF765_05755 [Polyangiaceae bacterium]
MKTHKVVGYVAVALACAWACGGSPATSIPVTAVDDGGAADSGGLAVASDAGGDDEADVPSGRSEGGAADGATNATPNAGPSQYCCVSGAYYACPTETALQRCTGFDVTGCFQSCDPRDLSCNSACGQKASSARTDPSACVHDASYDALCASVDAGPSSTSSGGGTPGPSPAPAPAPAPTPKNACGGYFLGTGCMAGGQCLGGGHCTQNKCYPNDVGNPCTFPNDCGDGNHCANGCCASPAKGSACKTAIDCTSGMCTGGVCK